MNKHIQSHDPRYTIHISQTGVLSVCSETSSNIEEHLECLLTDIVTINVSMGSLKGEAYLEPYQTSKMKHCAEIVTDF